MTDSHRKQHHWKGHEIGYKVDNANDPIHPIMEKGHS